MQICNVYHTLPAAFYRKQAPTPLDDPILAHFNDSLAQELGTNRHAYDWQAVMAGRHVPEDFDPLAMAYAGHQFGVWAGQLGDGRGLLLAQVKDKAGRLCDLHLKGAGKTPYSRHGDGRAVIRSTLREYLGGHALACLGVPSSRALGFCVSDTPVWREMPERAATLIRVADCHVRFGHFEWAAAFAPKKFSAFTHQMMAMYYPCCLSSSSPVVCFLRKICHNTARLIAHWQAVGFAHGVMNTDNLGITGTTLDFGPFAFLERFDPAMTYNLSDQTGRYAYQNQPTIGHYNLQKLFSCFVHMTDKQVLLEILSEYEPVFFEAYAEHLLAKLGVDTPLNEDKKAAVLQVGYALLSLMNTHQLDYTNTFRALIGVLAGDTDEGLDDNVLSAKRLYDELKGNAAFESWHRQYLAVLRQVGLSDRTRVMAVLAAKNPVYVLRYQMAQRAIQGACQNNFTETDRLFRLLSKPYDVQSIATLQDTTPAATWEIGVSCSS